MKRKLIYVAVMAAAIMVSCNGKKTAQNEANNDSTSIADTTVADENVDLATVAGTRVTRPLCRQHHSELSSR